MPRSEQVAGTLMVQPEVYAPDGTKRLLDDLVPMEWLYVTAGFEEQGWMEGMEETWRRIGGRRIVILPGGDRTMSEGMRSGPSATPAGVEFLHETGATFARWCSKTGLRAVLVRPDRYIYAAVNDRTDLAARLKGATCEVWGDGWWQNRRRGEEFDIPRYGPESADRRQSPERLGYRDGSYRISRATAKACACSSFAVVIGGARGIGLAVGRCLLRDGWRVAVADLDPFPKRMDRQTGPTLATRCTTSVPISPTATP